MPAELRVLISQSALFNAGMGGFYPGLKILNQLAKADEGLPRARRERIVETFLRRLPRMSDAPVTDSPDFAEAWRTAQPTRPHAAAERLGQWAVRFAAEYTDEAENLFARRCAAVLIELYSRTYVALPKPR